MPLSQRARSLYPVDTPGTTKATTSAGAYRRNEKDLFDCIAVAIIVRTLSGGGGLGFIPKAQ